MAGELDIEEVKKSKYFFCWKIQIRRKIKFQFLEWDLDRAHVSVGGRVTEEADHVIGGAGHVSDAAGLPDAGVIHVICRRDAALVGTITAGHHLDASHER